MTKRICMVQGSSRGLGVAFTRQLLENPNNHVIATARDPSQSQALTELHSKYSDRLTTYSLDVSQENTIAEAAKQIKESFGGVDLMINSAGVLHPEKSITQLSQDDLWHTFQVNTIGPMLVAKHFMKELVSNRKGKQENEFPVWANMSARVGSIGDNKIGGWYSYRSSKAGINQLTKSLSREFGRKGVVCVSLHPGTVDTDMSKPFQRNVRPEKLFSPKYAATSLLQVIGNLTQEDNGTFIAYDGSKIEW
eukprot:gb/GECH01001077.1/.p1 GENE.gb/GECH01001077.1/~~gb/GECH01001077.1/.p1  ORF type:complete len:250 (+),score=77.08 gb/GECH01001077.1/:1-750(+)